MAAERLPDTRHVVEPVPPAHLKDHPHITWHRGTTQDRAPVGAHGADPAVAPHELQAAVVVLGVDAPCLAQGRVDVDARQLGVLSRERVQ